MPDDQMNKIRQLLEGFDTAVLVTHGSDWPFHARPMAIARVEPNCDLWFFTGRSSAKADEIQHDHHVLIICQNERGCYLALRGRARLVSARARAAELWKKSYQLWFPKGPEDPAVMLIQVKAKYAEYWESEGLKSMQHLFEAAKALARGTQPHTAESERHGTVSFAE